MKNNKTIKSNSNHRVNRKIRRAGPLNSFLRNTQVLVKQVQEDWKKRLRLLLAICMVLLIKGL